MIGSRSIEKYSSKIGFLFICFVVIASGYVTQVLPCQTQQFLTQNIFAKHAIGILICFLFIMLEGGWSFDMDQQNQADVDWSNGNAIDSFVYGFILYFIFLLTAKTSLIPNILLYTILFSIYMLSTQRNYWNNRQMITPEQNNIILKSIELLIMLFVIVFIYGLIDYIDYKIKKHGSKFSIYHLILSTLQCNSIKKM